LTIAYHEYIFNKVVVILNFYVQAITTLLPGLLQDAKY